MPRLNRYGDWCAGIGGGVVSVNGQIVLPYQSGGANWVNDDTVIGQVCSGESCQLKTWNRLTGTVQTVLDHGANFIEANGGVWAAWFGSSDASVSGVTTSYGGRFPSSGLGPVGPDGAVAIKLDYNSFGPWYVVETTGERWLLTEGDAGNINLLGNGRAVWSEPGGVVAARRLLPPKPVTVPFYHLRVLLGPEPLVLYQTNDDRLVLHPFDSTEGYVVTTGNAYRPDLCLLANGHVRVVWAVSEGEPPPDVRFVDVDLNEPRVELLTVQPQPDPKPDPIPEPEPVPELPASLQSDVAAERAKYPAMLTEDQPAKILNAVAWNANKRLGRAEWGLSVKKGGHRVPSPQGVDVAYDILHHKPTDTLWGCFTNDLKADVNWGQEAHHHDPNRPWLAPINPGVPQPEPDPDPKPEPIPSDDLAKLRAQVQAMNEAILYNFGTMSTRLDQLTERLTKLEQAPAGTAREYRVVVDEHAEPLSTGSRFGHSHQIKLAVVPK